MPDHAPAPEQTVRLDTGRPSLRPPLTRGPAAPAPTRPASAGPDTADSTATWPVDLPDLPVGSGADIASADAELTAPVGLLDEGLAVDDTDATGLATGFDDDPADDLADDPGGDDGDAGEPPQDGPPAGSDRGRPWWRRPAVLVPGAAVTVLAAAYGADLLVAGGDVPRHTVVDGVQIGGLSPTAAQRTLQQQLAPRLAKGHAVVAADVRTALDPADAGVRLDTAATVAAARAGAYSPWARLTSLFSSRAVAPRLATDRTALDAAVTDLATQVDRAPVDATVTVDGTTASVVAAADGRALDRRAAAAAITSAVATPGATVRLPVAVTHAAVATAEAQRVLDATVRPALAAPVTVVSQDGGEKAQISAAALGRALTVTPSGGRLTVGVDPAKLQAALGPGFVGFGSPAHDATFAVSGGSVHVVPSVDGTGVDPAKLATQLAGVLASPAPRTVTAELGPVHAAFTTEMAQQLGITEQVSSFTTHFAATPSATNIRVVAAKVDGALVKPGETFSLNDFTGPRGTAQGYVPAMVIEGGKFVPAVGGGISQFATTMYNAVFFAGLQDVHHQPHSYWISRYPAGREATVFDGLIDLAWKNDSPTGIYVQTTWVQGSITVTFWGTKHYDVESVSGPRTNVVEPPVQDAPDDGTCKAQSGQQGFDIVVTRVWHPIGSGQVLRKADFHTHYKAEPVIHCIPTGGAPAPAPTTPASTAPAVAPTPSARRPGRRGPR